MEAKATEDPEEKHPEIFSQAYVTCDLIWLKDSDNPLDPVNDIHDFLKKFLNAYSGFNRDSLQDF